LSFPGPGWVRWERQRPRPCVRGKRLRGPIWPRSRDNVVNLQYTSGTAGFPKARMLSKPGIKRAAFSDVWFRSGPFVNWVSASQFPVVPAWLAPPVQLR
jgi:acyl-CoA synthetase (AMP-forming)/AMP-acid ligase II